VLERGDEKEVVGHLEVINSDIYNRAAYKVNRRHIHGHILLEHWHSAHLFI